MTVKTTPPPVWTGRPGGQRPTTVLWAADAYAHAVSLALPIGDELIAAVQRVGRASALNASATARIELAERAYRTALADHVAHGAPMPTLDKLAEAVAVEGVTQRARGHIGHLQDEMDSDAVRHVRAAAPGWITAARPLHDQVLDDLGPLVPRIPAKVRSLEEAARAGRDALAAWQAAEDLLPRWTHVTGLRHRLAQLSAFNEQTLADGVLGYRGGAAVIDRLLGGLQDSTAVLVGTARHRDQLKPWYPSDDQIREEIEARKQAASERRGAGMRVLG